MAVFDHGWYRRVLEERCDKLVRKSEWREAYQQINEFERWLADDNQLLIKLWMNISKKKQRQRFKRYLADPNLAWRVTTGYRRQHREYENWLPAVDEMLAKTETPYAPWSLIEANDRDIFETVSYRSTAYLATSSASLSMPWGMFPTKCSSMNGTYASAPGPSSTMC